MHPHLYRHYYGQEKLYYDLANSESRVSDVCGIWIGINLFMNLIIFARKKKLAWIKVGYV